MMFGEGLVNLPSIMKIRTPTTLCWLLDKRARLAGKITYIEEKLQNFASLSEKVDRLRQDLLAIDHTISLYEIPVDPTQVPSIKPLPNARALPWGRMTRAIYRCLATDKTRAFSALEIATFVMRNEDVTFSAEGFIHFRMAIRRRLKSLLYAGKVTRLQTANGRRSAYWQFKDIDQCDKPELDHD
ncbi:hypothetical protein HPT27_11530 [Permianibacter sp. IMCC34836]|uniref:hypothetical protein n=1 Tax=Permianibacter fluminis TaxID=2738515 RepID=UPI001553D9DE|nr:hypothetical protein [Permianibacter fluminis]NQD37657.1 hypothetical protein [Permianibacter fluminis]